MQKMPLDLAALGIIALLVVSIFLTNFSGNFWITGWDNIHAELALSLNIKRAFFSTWQEYQGLGLPAGNAHAAELLRELFLLPLSPFFPAETLRKIVLSMGLFAGSLGMYIFIRNSFCKNTRHDLKILLSTIGALYYILTLATVQIFYVPFEPFIVFFACFPWLIYTTYQYFQNPSRKTLLFVFLANLFASPAFFIPTVFIVSIGFIGILTLGMKKESESVTLFGKRIALLALCIFVTNSYWLLPFCYYITHNIVSQKDAYLNIMYNQDIYLQNAKFANLGHVALLRGFLFDYVSATKNGTHEYMLRAWNEYLQTPFGHLGYVFFGITMLGVFASLRKRMHLSFVFLFILLISLLAFNDFPFLLVNSLLRKIALFDEIFRNPYTKFSNVLLFLYALFFVSGIQYILEFILKHTRQKTLVLLMVGISVCILLIVFVWPIWRGNFVFSSLKITIPKDYFDTFTFFKGREGRIANLPQYTPNGWQQYRWGYVGSGFLWYGIENPILDRAFDVWQKNNENYYWELSQAVYAKNLSQFESVLQKYTISWLLLDRSITTSPTKALYVKELEELLSSSLKIHHVKTFGQISIYSTDLASHPKQFIYLLQNPPLISPPYTSNDRDSAFLDNKDYLLANTNSSSIYYPFRSLFTGKTPITLQENERFISLKAGIPKEFRNADLILPQIGPEELVNTRKNGLITPEALFPKVLLNDQTVTLGNNLLYQPVVVSLSSVKAKQLEIQIPRTKGYYSYDSFGDNTLFYQIPKTCDSFNKGIFEHQIIEGENNTSLKLTSLSSSNCVALNLDYLSQRLSYLLSVESKNIVGKGLFLSLTNNDSSHIDMATYLPISPKNQTASYIIPSKQYYGIGYTLLFDNVSIGKQKTENVLGRISIDPLPYFFLTSLRITKEHSLGTTVDDSLTQYSVSHPNPTYYEVSIPQSKNQPYLVLSQSFDDGWKAYQIASKNILTTSLPFLFGKELPNHVLVNNWANGWSLNNEAMKQPSNETIVIIFLPQYLEYIGFLLLFLSILLMLIRVKK